MRQGSGIRRMLLPIVAVWPLVLMATSGGPVVAAREAGVVPATDCPSCDDFNPCTVDACDAANGTCRHDPLSCDDGDSCTEDSCSFDPAHPASGGCVHATRPAGSACDDGLVCTLDDICSDTGACVGQIQPAGAACDDGNSCTGPDACDDAGRCVAQGESAPGSPCDDGSLCTSDDACVTTETGAIACRGVSTACDDGDPCTRDTCDPSTGVCGAAPIVCDDGNVCTMDACDPSTGLCTRTNIPGSCNDGNACTVDDACSGGNCLGSPEVCDDGNSCTADSCDPATGCSFTPEPDGQACDDANACTTSDTCRGGTCQGAAVGCDDGNSCTADSCDPATGCRNTPTNDACNDGNVCTTSDACSGGFCAGTPISCDDGRDCTLDSCNPTSGCAHAYDARLPDNDSDGVPDSCDNCPAASNRLQLDCNANAVGDACDPSLYEVRLLTTTAQGKGSGEVVWSTVCETDLRGFNVLMIDNQGGRTRLNNVPIPCSECITGGSGTYSTFIPKHKSGRNIYLEVLYRTSVNLVVGPATKQ